MCLASIHSIHIWDWTCVWRGIAVDRGWRQMRRQKWRNKRPEVHACLMRKLSAEKSNTPVQVRPVNLTNRVQQGCRVWGHCWPMGVEGHDLVHHPRRLGQITSLITSHHRLGVGLVVRLTGHRQRRRGLAENSEPRVSRLVYGTVLRWNKSRSIDCLYQRGWWNPGNIEASSSRCDAGPCPWSHRIHQRLTLMVRTGMGSVSKSRSGTWGQVSMRTCEQRATGGKIDEQQVDTKETSALCRQVSHLIVIPQMQRIIGIKEHRHFRGFCHLMARPPNGLVSLFNSFGWRNQANGPFGKNSIFCEGVCGLRPFLMCKVDRGESARIIRRWKICWIAGMVCWKNPQLHTGICRLCDRRNPKVWRTSQIASW